ncbi:hypothetical protein MA16_Dca022446 [Dendrobium catenatum]|uniref:Uncharacterized protein n=1 Tax=Dendrobium catenatum TaxID=906689 RepID=A0A2I0WHS1_9ASPA|nr:hypothetical protein MA16_Dca022446 [Dendrobium catenatum]
MPHTDHKRHLKEVLGREPTPVKLHSHTHKRQEDQQWIDERARKAYHREIQVEESEGSSGGSAEYSEYHTWSQEVGRTQQGRVYGLGSQAYAYEGQKSCGSSFLPNTQESLYTQQIATLTAELEQVRKAQTDWHIQIQQQMEMQQQIHIQQQKEMQQQMHMLQTQILEEIRKMRDEMSGRSTT